MKYLSSIVFTTILLSLSLVNAQTNADDLEIINVEDLYKKEAPKPSQLQTTTPPSASSAESAPTDPGSNSTEGSQANEAATTANQESVEQPIEVKELKDLNKMVPFSEISVIQKKYLPKTGRFQFFLGAGITTNTPWFTNYGGKANLGYHFTESFGLELSTLFLTSSQRQVAKELLDNHGVQADQFIYTKGYYGLDLVWSPVYGKIAWNNKKIINYEMYFSLGGGTSSTKSKEENVSTVHLGLGQIFALSKGVAFRWDYGINIFQATPISSNTTSKAEKGSYNDMVLTAGLSFFFPEADYR